MTQCLSPASIQNDKSQRVWCCHWCEDARESCMIHHLQVACRAGKPKHHLTAEIDVTVTDEVEAAWAVL